MKKLTIAAALATATMLSSPALAADAGTVQVKLMATGVLPDGKIDKVNINAVGLPATTQTTANDNVVPTLAIDLYEEGSVKTD
jgi:outer membrane protein